MFALPQPEQSCRKSARPLRFRAAPWASGHRLILSLGERGFVAVLDLKGLTNALGEAEEPAGLDALLHPHRTLPIVFRLPEGCGFRGTATLPLVEAHELKGLLEAEASALHPAAGPLALAVLDVDRDVRRGRTVVDYVAIPKDDLDRWLLLAARWGVRPNALEIGGTTLHLLAFSQARPRWQTLLFTVSCAFATVGLLAWIVFPDDSGRSMPRLKIAVEMVQLSEQMRAIKVTRPMPDGADSLAMGVARGGPPATRPSRPAVVRYEILDAYAGSASALVGWFVDPQNASVFDY